MTVQGERHDRFPRLALRKEKEGENEGEVVGGQIPARQSPRGGRDYGSTPRCASDEARFIVIVTRRCQKLFSLGLLAARHKSRRASLSLSLSLSPSPSLFRRGNIGP